MRPIILLKYHFYSFWNWRSVYFGRFIEPIAYLVFLFAGLQTQLSGLGVSYPIFALTGISCLLSFRAATAAMSDVSNDRKWGVYAIYTMQGGGAVGYLLSVVLFYSLVYLAQFSVLFLCAIPVFGWNSVSDPLVLNVAVIGFLFVVGWTGVGAAVGARVESYATRDLLVTLTTLPVVLAAPLFYPISSDHGLLYYVSLINPLTYQVNWMRDSSLSSFGLSVLWALVGMSIGALFLRSAERLSRER